MFEWLWLCWALGWQKGLGKVAGSLLMTLSVRTLMGGTG